MTRKASAACPAYDRTRRALPRACRSCRPDASLLDVAQASASRSAASRRSATSRSTLPRGGLHGLIGPNGAGKTTVFNLLTGVYRRRPATISLDGERIDGLKPYRDRAAGMARTFQNIRLFGEPHRARQRAASACTCAPSSAGWSARRSARRGFVAQETGDRPSARCELLEHLRPRRPRATSTAADLPYGDQRRLEIARALATEPKLLLLDEPAAGMNTGEKVELRRSIRSLRDALRRRPILLIEHDMGLVMDICERITVLDHGVTIADGTPRRRSRAIRR